MLVFKINGHSVILTDAISEERAEGALMAHHPKITRGSWDADEATKIVAVDVDTAKATYTNPR
jgi:hypothetical protein